MESDSFKSYIEIELKLTEGELLLLEEDGRGYFRPRDVKFGSIQEAMEELKFIKE